MTNNAVRQPDERQRALTAVDLRVQGHTYAQIAAALDYGDESGARHAVSRLLARREAESIDELRAVQSARLEAVLHAFWAATTSGDTHAARIVLRTLDSLAKLYGLDAPTRFAVDPVINDVDFANEAARLIESIVSLGGAEDLLRSLSSDVGQAVRRSEPRAPLIQTGTQLHAKSDGVASDEFEPWSNI